jgi:hypothetical protein
MDGEKTTKVSGHLEDMPLSPASDTSPVILYLLFPVLPFGSITGMLLFDRFAHKTSKNRRLDVFCLQIPKIRQTIVVFVDREKTILKPIVFFCNIFTFLKNFA